MWTPQAPVYRSEKVTEYDSSLPFPEAKWIDVFPDGRVIIRYGNEIMFPADFKT